MQHYLPLFRDQCTALSVQEASQRFAIVALGLLGHAGIRRLIEAVIRPRVHVKLNRNSATAQAIRIGHVFFEEEIKTTVQRKRGEPTCTWRTRGPARGVPAPIMNSIVSAVAARPFSL
jgi:hypothetical protein